MRDTLAKYGDAWILAGAVCLTAAVAFAALGSGMTPGRALLSGGGALLLATVVSLGLARLRDGRGRPTVFLTPRRREAALVAALLALLSLPAIGFLRQPPEVPPPPREPNRVREEIQKWVNAVPPGPQRTQRGTVGQTAEMLLDRRQQLEPTAAAGGLQAGAAAREIEQIDRYLEEVLRRIDEGRTQEPGKLSLPPTPKELPPLPRVTQIHGDAGEDAFQKFLEALAGPLGKLVGDLLGLSLGGGYRTQVQMTVSTMTGQTAPSPQQIAGLLDAVPETDGMSRKREVLEHLGRIGDKMLPPDQLAIFRDRLAAAAATLRTPVAEQILERLQQAPPPSPEVLLGFLDGDPRQFASEEQRQQVEKALRGHGFGAQWDEVFAEITVRGAAGDPADLEGRP